MFYLDRLVEVSLGAFGSVLEDPLLPFFCTVTCHFGICFHSEGALCGQRAREGSWCGLGRSSALLGKQQIVDSSSRS